MKRTVLPFCLMIFILWSFPFCAVAQNSITIDKEIIIALGLSKSINYSVISAEENEIIWESSDKQIATVSKNGVVKAKSVGQTKISATFCGITEYCSVFVREEAPKIFADTENNYLFGFRENCRYTIENELFTSDSSGKIQIKNTWLSKTVKISKYNDTEKCCSENFELYIEHTHCFVYDKTVAPDCEEKGYDVYACICLATEKRNNVSKLNHLLSEYKFDENYHYKECERENCGYKTESEKHIFDNENDDVCNICSYVRTLNIPNEIPCENGHTFDNDCDSLCNICRFERKITHKYVNDCVAVCSVCGFIRDVSHIFDNSCDSICNICGYKRNVTHLYSSVCATTCELCGFTRIAEHKLSENYTKTARFHSRKCLKCGEETEKSMHIFDEKSNKCIICERKRKTKVFSDLSADSQWYRVVMYNYSIGTFAGYKNNAFGVADNIKREDFILSFVKFCEANRETEETSKSPFADVEKSAYYFPYVCWGKSSGIINGYQNGNFGVGDFLTRQDLITILYNYAKKNEIDTGLTRDKNYYKRKYSDFDDISDYAVDAVVWAIDKAVIKGTTEKTLSPKSFASRAQTAQIFYNIDCIFNNNT